MAAVPDHANTTDRKNNNSFWINKTSLGPYLIMTLSRSFIRRSRKQIRDATCNEGKASLSVEGPIFLYRVILQKKIPF